MLNRIYIAVGFFAIIVLSAIFIVPKFMNWSDYRSRVEMIASEALGVDVKVKGEIDFSLLPLPTMKFNDVIVASRQNIIVKIASISAEFSLMDFLRDHYVIKDLNLISPQVFLSLNEDGRLISNFNIPKNFNASNISIGNAKIKGGELQFFDERNGNSWQINDFEGKLQLGGLRGPFILDGNLKYQNKQYRMQVNSRAFNENDEVYLNLFLTPKNKAFSLKSDGVLKIADEMQFVGNVEFRQRVKMPNENERGDGVLKSKIEISSKQILLPDYVFIPDENRPITRLNGALDISLGKENFYNLIISGGIVNLDMPNAILGEKLGLLQILNEIKIPVLPMMNGVIGLDVSELNYKGLSFKNIRIDANSNKNQWNIKKLRAQIFNKISILFNGVIANENKPNIIGNIRLENLPLKMPNSLFGKVSLFDDVLSLSDGKFIFDGVENNISFEIAKNDISHSLNIVADLAAFDANQSLVLEKLIPLESLTPSFLNIFSSGIFDIRAKENIMLNMKMQNLRAKGSWQKQDIIFESLSVSEFGGAKFNFAGSLNIDKKQPNIFGNGNLELSEKAQAGIFPSLFPNHLQQYFHSSLPVNLTFFIKEPNEENTQLLEFSGKMGVADISTSIIFSKGVFNYVGAPLKANLQLVSNDVQAFSKQFGFDGLPLVEASSTIGLGVKIDGSIFNSLDVELLLSGAKEKARFLGNIFVANAKKWKGKGRLEMLDYDIEPFFEYFGLVGFGAGAVSGNANLIFDGIRDIEFENIDILLNERKISGNISRIMNENEVMNFTGDLKTEILNISALAKLFGGNSSLIVNDGVWAAGPFSFNQSDKNSFGRIKVKSNQLHLGDKKIASEAGFDFIWNEKNTRIAAFNAKVGKGKVVADIGFCCKSNLAEKELKGRVNILGVDIALLFPKAISNILKGRVDIGANFSGFGVSYADIVQNLIGEGSFALSDVKIEQFSPLALSALNDESDILEAKNEILEEKVKVELEGGSFEIQKISGVMNIANSIVRANNVSGLNEGVELFGDMQIDLRDFSIKGFWRLSELVDGNSSFDSFHAIGVNIFGTLFIPKIEFDISQLIDEMKTKALEKEVERLEKLQKEAKKRQEEAKAEAARAEAARAEAARAEEEAKKEAERIAAEKLKAEKLANQQTNLQPQEPSPPTIIIVPEPPPINLLQEIF